VALKRRETEKKLKNDLRRDFGGSTSNYVKPSFKIAEK